MNGKGSSRLRSFTMDQPVNLSKASTVCNTFYVFLSAAKAALLPFLTLFFRLIGLNAFDTGIIMAAKTLTGFVWAPLWARCAAAYNKRRLVLIFSLLMMSVMYLSFIGVYYKVGDPVMCSASPPGDLDGNSTGAALGNSSGVAQAGGITEGPSPGAGEAGNAAPTKPDGSTNANGGASPSSGTAQDTDRPSQTSDTTGSQTHESGTKLTEQTTETPAVAGSVPGNTSSGAANTSNHEQEPQAVEQSSSEDQAEQIDPEAAQLLLQPYGMSLDSLTAMSAHQLYNLFHKYVPNMNLTEENIQQIKDIYASTKAQAGKSRLTSQGRHARNLNFVLLNKLKETVGSMAATLEEQKLLLFLVILLIVIFGEFFSSPVEKIADDAWFDFLERIDDMEKYGRQRYWGSFAFAIIPIVVGIAVDFTPCQLVLNLHHFLIHFYVFGVFMVITIGVALYFPMPPPVKQKYHSKVGKGLRLICCDCRGFLFVVTLLIAGMLYASFNNFLFWHLLDMGSQEVTMGLCVSIGAFAETPMLVFSGKLVRKLGNGWVVALALLVLALRLLYYGFVWTPWAVLPVEVTNAFTHTALWYAILSYDEFNQGSAMDRSIRSILSSFYFGLGFSVGSLLSGLVFHVYGANILFWGASVVSITWCLVYSAFQLCLPKKEKVKYIKLLRKRG
nr:hypothetical protein BaRGS_031444 [Batillaria attramentaria]